MNKRLLVSVVSSAALLALVWSGTGLAAGPPATGPAVVTGPLGPLVTYEDCSGDQQTALGTALNGIGTTLQGNCVAGAALKQCLSEKSGSITIKCGGGGCTTDDTLAGEAPRGGNWVRICPRTFDNAQRLEAVLFHELVHSCDRDEPTAEACQNACYEGKGATPPDEGEEGGTCNGHYERLQVSPIAPAAPTAPQQIVAALAVAPPIVVWGDPFTLTFQLLNTHSTDVITVSTRWYDPNKNNLLVIGTSGAVPANILREVNPPVASSYVALPPGGTFTDHLVITPEHYSLRPGPYTLQLNYANWDTFIHAPDYPYPIIGNANAWIGTASSNIVLIHIHPRAVIYLPLVRRS